MASSPHSLSGYRAEPLLRRVVDGGFCIGCGACAAVSGSPLRMKLQWDGLYRPEYAEGRGDVTGGQDLGDVCPFYSSIDETALGVERFGKTAFRDPRVGFFRALYAGAVADEARRAQSSSGGIVTWVLEQLLDEGLIDGVIHVSPSPQDDEGALFRYQVSTEREGIAEGAKSRYYPVEFSRVTAFVREHPGRYAFVGVPCFVKAIRLLARQDADVAQAVQYCIALFCGHMKSAAYAQHLGWQLGLPPDDLEGIDFRAKQPGQPANRYAVTVTGRRDDEPFERTAPMRSLHGGDWGLGLFKPGACDFCDDIAGETADLACGDAWLPRFIGDSRGTSVIIVRSRALEELLDGGWVRGELTLQGIEVDDVVASQAASYRHRGEGLAYRLALWDDAGLWRPLKRVTADKAPIGHRRRRIYELRLTLARRSHGAFAEARRRGRHAYFRWRMAPLLLRYYAVSEGAVRALAKAALRRLPAGVRPGRLL